MRKAPGLRRLLDENKAVGAFVKTFAGERGRVPLSRWNEAGRSSPGDQISIVPAIAEDGVRKPKLAVVCRHARQIRLCRRSARAGRLGVGAARSGAARTHSSRLRAPYLEGGRLRLHRC